MSDPQKTPLDSLDRPALQTLWAEIHGQSPPECFYARRLILGIAFRQQLDADPTLQQLQKRVKKQLRRVTPTGSLPSYVRLHPGARLIREWNGSTHEVTVTDDGFRYRERRYNSLSAIAREITGTRWSGPAFFGVAR